MSESITIPAKYNGPPHSGNGGYSCGAIATLIKGAAKVRLHSPPPLDTELKVKHQDDGAVEVFYGDTLVGSASRASLDIAIPSPPSKDEAEQAQQHYPCKDSHLFPTCFVCGTQREHGDGLELFTGPTGSDGTVACLWQPRSDQLDDNGYLRAEIIWSALDCPGYYAAMGSELKPALLGELLADVYQPAPANAELIVYAWPLGQRGRKYYAGTAVATTDGEVLAAGHTTWIVLQR